MFHFYSYIDNFDIRRIPILTCLLSESVIGVSSMVLQRSLFRLMRHHREANRQVQPMTLEAAIANKIPEPPPRLEAIEVENV